ncbi:hypothetical protein AAID96_03550 [Campylobacter coli]
MTAYVHIGTEKTGTTSIQTFLSNNRDLLKKQEIIYTSSLGSNGSQWSFTFLAYNNIRSDEYCLSGRFYTKHNFKKHKNKIFLNLKKELKKTNCRKLLISSEHLSSRLQDLREIKRCKEILNILGFKEIKILVYLREISNMVTSSYSTELKAGKPSPDLKSCYNFEYLGAYNKILFKWQKIFGKENLIVRLFDKDKFYQGDLLKDFIYSMGLKWDDGFFIPLKQNETLDLIGIELLKRINKHLPWQVEDKINHSRGDLSKYICQYFQNSKDPHLKFQPPKEIIQSYIDYFEESNEWVRKEFFPHKERLFPKKDLTDYKENYELKEMKPEYWDRIAEFVADIVKTKNQTIFLQRIQNQLSYKLGQAMIVNSRSLLGYIIMPIILLSITISYKQEKKNHREKIKKYPSLKLPPLETYPDYQEALKEKEYFTYKLGEALIKANKTWYKGGHVRLILKDIPKLKRDFRQKR